MRLQDIFQLWEHQAEFHVSSIVGCKKAARGNGNLVLVRRMGIDDEETWEPISRVLEAAPAVLNKGLKRLRLSSEDTKQLRECYGFSV